MMFGNERANAVEIFVGELVAFRLFEYSVGLSGGNLTECVKERECDFALAYVVEGGFANRRMLGRRKGRFLFRRPSWSSTPCHFFRVFFRFVFLFFR